MVARLTNSASPENPGQSTHHRASSGVLARADNDPLGGPSYFLPIVDRSRGLREHLERGKDAWLSSGSGAAAAYG